MLVEGLESADEDTSILQDAPHAIIDVLQHLAALPHSLQEEPPRYTRGLAPPSSRRRVTRGPSPWLQLFQHQHPTNFSRRSLADRLLTAEKSPDPEVSVR